jgi:hypothetical protein
MKTTVEMPDSLLVEAKAYARRRRVPLRQVLQEGLRLALDQEHKGQRRFRLRDASRDLGAMKVEAWPEIRRIIYSGRGE